MPTRPVSITPRVRVLVDEGLGHRQQPGPAQAVHGHVADQYVVAFADHREVVAVPVSHQPVDAAAARGLE